MQAGKGTSKHARFFKLIKPSPVNRRIRAEIYIELDVSLYSQ